MICTSDYREEMDELFVNWHNVSQIAKEYNTPRRTRSIVTRTPLDYSPSAIATFVVRWGSSSIAPKPSRDITGDSVIRAVRTLAHINESGEWVNPPTHVIVSSGAALQTNPERSLVAEPSRHSNYSITPGR